MFRALHRPPEAFWQCEEHVSNTSDNGGGLAHPQDARAVLHRKSDHVQRFGEGDGTAWSLENFVEEQCTA